MLSESHKYRDMLLWTGAITIVGMAVVANSMYADQPLALRLVGWIFVAAIVGGTLLFGTSQGQKFKQFAKEAQAELRKVVWPAKQETVRATLMVFAMVLLVSLILWGLDSILFWLVKWVTYVR